MIAWIACTLCFIFLAIIGAAIPLIIGLIVNHKDKKKIKQAEKELDDLGLEYEKEKEAPRVKAAKDSLKEQVHRVAYNHRAFFSDHLKKDEPQSPVRYSNSQFIQ